MTGFSDPKITIFLTISSGEGFSDSVTLDAGTTIQDVFDRYVGGNPKAYHISINGMKDNPSNTVLNDGDRVRFTPDKIKVAH
ncbi:MAG: hypothetical protein ACO395_07415 [Pontimonas sp.]